MRIALAVILAVTTGGAPQWEAAAPLPVARTEVAAARFGNEIGVVGGYVAEGSTTARADAFTPAANRWRRLPDLPLAVNHAAAAGYQGRLYVVGGYSAAGPSRRAFVFAAGGWHRLPDLPGPRAAAAAAVASGKLYVVGGVRGRSPRLARRAFVLDLARRRWTTIAGPTPREHLAAAAAGRTVYAIAGRTFGYDTNVSTFEVYDRTAHRWRRLPPVPAPRGGAGAAAVGTRIVSVGGEAPPGTVAAVYAYRVGARRWSRLPDLPTPRHGLGVVAFGRSVYVIGGGPQPGLSTSAANEVLTLPLR